VIGQKDRRFSEESVTIRSGGKLRFVNDDSIAHNVYARDPAGGNQSGVLQKPGEEFDLTFAVAGEHQVLCAIHPRMRMTVRVQP
jgi:plastocyanin